jgi:hypothetical protein
MDGTRISVKMDSSKVISVLYEEMRLWGQRSERGALGIVLGRLLEMHRVPERGLIVNYPAFLVGGNKQRKKRAKAKEG